MAFQFYCPQGHLLEGQESQMGRQGQCPLCGSLFVFPMLGGASQAAASASTVGPFVGPLGGAAGGVAATPHQFHFGPPQFNAGNQFAGVETSAPTGAVFPGTPEPPPPAEPRTFRILCPQGHELHTPEDMLGTEALCPYCNSRMALRYEDSLEYRAQQELEQRLREEKAGRFWMNAAVWSAVVVVLVFVGLIVYTQMR